MHQGARRTCVIALPCTIYNPPAKPLCLQHTAEELWYWAYLTVCRDSSHHTGNPNLNYTVLCSSVAMKPGEALKSSVSLQVDRLAMLTRSHVSDCSSHDQSRFRPKFTATPSYTYELVGWQEEHPVGNSEENPSYQIGVLNFNSRGCVSSFSLSLSPKEILFITHKKQREVK